MQLVNLTPQQLRKAADLQERIQSLQKELESILGVSANSISAPAVAGRRTLSAAGRAAIAAAARARWAKARGQGTSAAAVKKPRRKMSAAGRARLAAAARERWKTAKAAGKSTL